MKKQDIYYQAMLTRDHRFDGKFFVGVKTTGVYCRPICPAKPKRENVEFFPNHFAAEKAGYRPCLRCRPESAPQSPAWIGKSAVVRRAVRILHSQEAIEFDEDKFASLFGVTSRHLRRLFVAEIGKTPKQLTFENRLNLARQLITETQLPITEVAYAAGFASIRRFNDAFKKRFTKAPRETRRYKVTPSEGLKISLSYRPPFDFDGLLKSYENHRVGNLEWFESGKMHRIIALNGYLGTLAISNNAEHSCLIVEIVFPDHSMLHAIIARVKNLFDLNSDPIVIANSLEQDTVAKKLLRKTPGIRLPSGWDAFETAIAAILGQGVSVEFSRTLMNDLIQIAGQDTGVTIHNQQIKLFPTPPQIIAADLSTLKTTTARRNTLVAFSQAIVDNKISLEPTQDIELFMQQVLVIKGIGLWTAQCMALKTLRDPDTFPASDLILARALTIHTESSITTMSPWRGYAAALFWRHYAIILKKSRRTKLGDKLCM